MDSKVLRFTARMVSSMPQLCKRPFIVSYFLADDTINVFENVHINSGMSRRKAPHCRQVRDLEPKKALIEQKSSNA